MFIKTSDESRRFCDIIIEHNNEELVWDTAWYGKATKYSVAEVFKEINEYWAELTFTRQTKIFEIYKEIHETLTDVFSSGNPMGELIEKIHRLYLEMPYSELEAWVNSPRSDIRLPSDLLTDYGDKPQARTYLRDDYRELVIFALALRPMVPIWGEYIRTSGDIAGNVYKEYAAMRLMINSWPSKCKPRERLLEYLENLIPRDPKNNSAIWSGLGTTELPEWLFALACVRRLSISPLSSKEEQGSLITSIYNFIFTNTFSSLDRKFKGMVVEKHRNDSRADNDNTSLVEAYKVKQPLSDGDLTMLSVYTEMVEDGDDTNSRLILASKIDPTIDMTLVEKCVVAKSRITNHEILPIHVTLTQYVINPAITAAGVENLNRLAILNAMAVTQAVLWHWGMYDLAALVTASPVNNGLDTFFGQESRPRVPKELVEKLLELYPHYQMSGNRTDAAHIEKQRRQNNVALRAIDTLSKSIADMEWTLYAPIELVRLSSSNKGNRRMYTPADIKAQLANLIIKIATRNEWLAQ